MRQCCLVRVSREVVGGSVCMGMSRQSASRDGRRMVPYTGPAIALQIRLHPAHVLTTAITPLGEDFAPAFEPVSGAAAYPKKDK